jgi:hypothetical protein
VGTLGRSTDVEHDPQEGEDDRGGAERAGTDRRRFGLQQARTGDDATVTGRRRQLVRRLAAPLPILALLAACEDAGNEGNDNLLTGGSLVLVVIVVVVIFLVLRRRT